MANIEADLEENTEVHDGISVSDDVIRILRAAVEDQTPETLDAARTALAALHPADAADAVEQLSRDQVQDLVRLTPASFTGEILAEMTDDVREDVVHILGARQVAHAITDLESDDALQVIEELPGEFREEVLDEVDPHDRTAMEALLAYDEDSVGRLMQREFVPVPQYFTVGQTIDHIRDLDVDTLPETFFEVYVVDPGFHPMGSVAVSRILRAHRDELLEEIMAPVQIRLTREMDKEDAAYLFEKYDLPSAPVVDDDGRLIGMITMDDMMNVIQEEHTEDLLALAGVSDASLSDTVWETVKSRAPWLVVNLGTAILASAVIALFDNAIHKLVALAVLMPIVASMGGNAGTQGLTVAVRALAVHDITRSNAMRIIVRELMAGFANGLIFAVIMGAVVIVWFDSWGLAGVIAVAMVINLFVAGLAGVLVPLGLKQLGADPAVASSVFVTMVTDVVGFFVFLGLAAMLLQHH